jgi:glucosamine--fructose-6-phosphate aminotransferase (isomerizing)
MFVLGKGYAEAIAREGALKIKEITYLHAEGYPGGALKHGPFALIEQDTPVVLVILDDEHANHMRTAAEEVRARGARTIIITDRASLADHVAHDTIVIPKDGTLAGLLATVPLQLIAYELAVLKGINPDKPRNLAKAVTVD